VKFGADGRGIDSNGRGIDSNGSELDGDEGFAGIIRQRAGFGSLILIKFSGNKEINILCMTRMAENWTKLTVKT
jgi:hypothetical protein